MTQPRNTQGQFSQKDEEKRKIRSVRLTDSTWNKLELIAKKHNISRSDLIGKLLNQEHDDLNEVIRLLEEALTLKPNHKGAIKNKIDKAYSYLIKLKASNKIQN